MTYRSINKRSGVDTTRVRTRQALETAYSRIQTEAFSLVPMKDAFVSLSNHILQWTGSTVDGFLTQAGLQVNKTYASIHETTGGGTISSSNLES